MLSGQPSQHSFQLFSSQWPIPSAQRSSQPPRNATPWQFTNTKPGLSCRCSFATVKPSLQWRLPRDYLGSEKLGLAWLTLTANVHAASRRLRSTETSQEVEAVAAMTPCCFLKDHLVQLPVIKSRQMGGQDSCENTNGDALQLQLGSCLSLDGQMGEGKASSQIKATS